MPAPANDNWANATVIGDSGAGLSAQIGGDNTLATAEVGEPANNGFTVWFKFTATASRPVMFATSFQPAALSHGAVYTDPYLKSVVQVFSGASVGSLGEVSYVN